MDYIKKITTKKEKTDFPDVIIRVGTFNLPDAENFETIYNSGRLTKISAATPILPTVDTMAATEDI
jgi:hypothetical protein